MFFRGGPESLDVGCLEQLCKDKCVRRRCGLIYEVNSCSGRRCRLGEEDIWFQSIKGFLLSWIHSWLEPVAGGGVAPILYYIIKVG